MLKELRASEANQSPLAELGRAFGLAPDDVEKVAKALLPDLALKLEKQSLSQNGLANIVDLIGATKPIAEDPSKLDTATAERLGIPILEELLGSKDGSRFLAARTARRTGVPADKIEDMLPGIGTMAMAGVARETEPAFRQLFDQIPSGSSSHAIPKQAPLPVPDHIPGLESGGQRSPYQDISDIFRRRAPAPQSSSGGALGKVIRDALGSALGYRNSGVMGWIVRLLLVRFAWPILRGVLGRIFR